MKVEAKLAGILAADAAIQRIADGRVYLRLAPQDALLPALTYFLVSERPVARMGTGVGGLFEATLQVSCWAAGNGAYAAVRELGDAVRLALVGQTFEDTTIHIQSVTEDDTDTFPPEVTPDLWHLAMTLSVIYRQKE